MKEIKPKREEKRMSELTDVAYLIEKEKRVIKNATCIDDLYEIDRENRYSYPICICGSSRFKNEIEDYAERLSLDGFVVYWSPVFTHFHAGEEYVRELSSVEIENLHRVHDEKIRQSNIILVVNPKGYYSKDTKREIDYAESLNKSVIFTDTPLKNRFKSFLDIRNADDIHLTIGIYGTYDFDIVEKALMAKGHCTFDMNPFRNKDYTITTRRVKSGDFTTIHELDRHAFIREVPDIVLILSDYDGIYIDKTIEAIIVDCRKYDVPVLIGNFSACCICEGQKEGDDE